MKHIVPFLLTVLIALPSVAASGEQNSLTNLLAGVTVSKKARLAVEDITVGSRSVRTLFQNTSPLGHRYDRYVGRTDSLTLKLNDRDAMNRLRFHLLETGASDVVIHLHDGGLIARVYARLPKAVLPGLYTHADIKLPVAVELTPCERMTRIIYREIDAILQQQLVRAAETGKPVSLDDVFDRLIRGTLKQYLDSLPTSVRTDPCFITYDLLKWVKNEDVRGFAFARYALTPEMHGILRVVADALAKVRRAQRYQLDADVVGFTDDITFKTKSHLPLTAAATGIKQLREPVDVFYGECSGDHTVEQAPYFVPLGKSSGAPVGASVDDNCELGAVRAYVAASALANMLGQDIRCRYATGGIARTTLAATAAEKRKIAIRITVKSAATR